MTNLWNNPEFDGQAGCTMEAKTPYGPFAKGKGYPNQSHGKIDRSTASVSTSSKLFKRTQGAMD